MADTIGSRSASPRQIHRIRKTIILILTLFTLGSGGLVASYFIFDRINADRDSSQTSNKPKLVSRDSGSIATTFAELKGDKPPQKFEQSAYQASYYQMDRPFTSNLKNSTSYAQLSISIATYYDERVLENIEEHETAIRSAILLVLAEQEITALNTQQGKQMLQEILTRAINKLLEEKTGFGGVNNVYFTSFVVQ